MNIDSIGQWLWTNSLTYGLITWHWVTDAVETGATIVQTSVRAVLSAQVNDVWLFRERNTTPWPMKEGWNDTSVTQFGMNMSWYPHAKEFLILSENTIQRNKSFTSVVMAELVCKDNNLRYDMSSFFHDIRWHSADGDAPSIYEVVTVFCLTNNLPFSSQLLKNFSLEVMTSDAVDLVVPVACMSPFSGNWADYVCSEEKKDAPVA